jgi:hypothetical protein
MPHVAGAIVLRFEAALSKLLRERGRTKEKLSQIVAEAKPALVVSQTGTADAIRGVDPDDFRLALDEASKRCRRPTPIRFINMQNSPRTEAILAVAPYADGMCMLALQREVVLFNRFSIMRRWSEAVIFDLYAATRRTDCRGAGS